MNYSLHKRKALSYFKEHLEFNATIHALGGFSVRVLAPYYFKLDNPLTWVIVTGVISILKHLYATSNGKK